MTEISSATTEDRIMLQYPENAPNQTLIRETDYNSLNAENYLTPAIVDFYM
jgi:Ulp1 family protease